jgi:endonuclease/exonuclease/phosphatase family metal-dependent hydrolase
MRIAAYNVENLFERAKIFNSDDPALARTVLAHQAELSAIIENPVYSEADRARMLELMAALGLLRSDEGTYVRLRRLRGRLIFRPRSMPPQIVANGRDDWTGWVELKTEAVNETAMLNTGRVILDVSADILAIVEAESRPALMGFQDLLLPDIARLDGLSLSPAMRYTHVMLIDGNDDRGIDVALATRAGLPIGTMRSHVDDRMPDGEPLFSRDCPEYEVLLPGGGSLWVLPNHFKSKYGGNDPRSRARRQAQAARVAEIVGRLKGEGHENIVVLGDLNDTPDSAELAPLLRGTGLRDVAEHPAFTDFQFRATTGDRGIGTFDTGRDDLKIDYILLSPALFAKVRNAGLNRKGAWTASNRWDMLPTLEREEHAASDHHAIFCDLDL